MGRRPFQEPAPAPISLRLLSWNLHATPVSGDNASRVRRAALAIAGQQPDVVLLQELWRTGDVRRVQAALGGGYELREVSTAGWFYRRSGLLTMVRRASGWTVEESRFHEFETEAGDWKLWEGDGLGDKGVQTLVLARGRARIGILNTHLQSAYSRGGYAAVRARQIAEFNGVAASLPGIPVLGGGDFNTSPEEPILDPFRHAWLDLAESYRRQCACGTHYLPDGSEGAWIDHLVARRDPSWRVNVERFELLRNTAVDRPYSDHHGLMAAVSLRPILESPVAAVVVAALVSPGRLTRRQWLRLCLCPLAGSLGTQVPQRSLSGG